MSKTMSDIWQKYRKATTRYENEDKLKNSDYATVTTIFQYFGYLSDIPSAAIK